MVPSRRLYTWPIRFKAIKDVMDALVHVQQTHGGRRAGRSNHRKAIPGNIDVRHTLS